MCSTLTYRVITCQLAYQVELAMYQDSFLACQDCRHKVWDARVYLSKVARLQRLCQSPEAP